MILEAEAFCGNENVYIVTNRAQSNHQYLQSNGKSIFSLRLSWKDNSFSFYVSSYILSYAIHIRFNVRLSILSIIFLGERLQTSSGKKKENLNLKSCKCRTSKAVATKKFRWKKKSKESLITRNTKKQKQIKKKK